jgi:hypothetical protein
VLPPEVWEKILSHIPPRDSPLGWEEKNFREDFYLSRDPFLKDKSGWEVKSGLENFYPSKEKHELAKIAERQWASEELVSLKKYGCKTAKDAIDYVIRNKMTGANLKEFSDLPV